jgi:(S)-2-hydroxyglutarate dehydrogenase
VPEITAGDLGPAFAGIRAQALARDGQLIDDFVVSETKRSIHVRNAPSPAATAAIPLARLIVDRLERIQD